MLACRYLLCAGLVVFVTGCLRTPTSSFASEDCYTSTSTEQYTPDLNDTAFNRPSKGQWQEEHAGKPLFETHIKNKKLYGTWKSWYTNGQLCDSGYMVNNLPDGIWKYWNKDGTLIAIRQYSAAKYSRVKDEMLRYNSRRSFYYLASLYQHNRAQALHYLSAGYSFSFSKSNTTGSPTKIVQANVNSGSGYAPVFAHCLHEGLYMNFFSNGAVQDSGYYKDGLKSGKWVHYESAAGISYQGRYLHGVRVKDWKLYNGAQKLQEVIHYDNKGMIEWRKKINR
jgi:antitoxin component YwqK of YwqJK toxin-antitoxin module